MLKVSQPLMVPCCMPRLNQRTRCSAVPWVNESVSTRPCARFWIRSSPDGLGGVDGALDVVLGQLGDDLLALGVGGLLGSLGPDAGQAVGHQLDAHGVALGTALGADLAEDAELVLDVVAVLVGDHVADRERPALGAELALSMSSKKVVSRYTCWSFGQ